MTTERLTSDVLRIEECDFIRYRKDGDRVVLFLVGDEEKEEEETEDDHCCEGLNGHLFQVTFDGVEDFDVRGDEQDSYVFQKVELVQNRLFIHLKGLSFFGGGGDLFLSFSFRTYQVADLGKIESPDV